MTKVEKQKLHSEKCSMEVVDCQLGRGLESRYLVAMSLTAGELIALKNALVSHQTAVGSDLDAYLTNAAYRAGIQL